MKLDILKNKALIWSSIGVLVLAVGIFVALQLIPQEQDIREEAAVQGGKAEIRIEPTSLSVAVGETKEATVSINTNTININGITTLLSYNLSQGVSQISIEDVQVKPPFSVSPWSCTNAKEVTGNLGVFNVICTGTGNNFNYTTNNTSVPVYTFKVKGVSATTSPVVLSFNVDETVITKVTEAGSQDNQRDILNIPTSVLRVTVTGAVAAEKKITVATPSLSCSANDFTVAAEVAEGATKKAGVTVTFKYNSETKTAVTNDQGVATTTFTKASSTQNVTAEATGYTTGSASAAVPTGCSSSPTPTATPTSSSTPTPTATPTTGSLSCNQSCSASRDCQSGLSCVSGYCRASQCASDSTCGCADLDVAAENGTTELPESGFDQTLALSLLGLLFLVGGGQLWWSHRAVEANRDEEQD